MGWLGFRLSVTAALAAGVLVCGGALVGPTPAAAQDREIVTYRDTDLPGFDYQTLKEIPLAVCESACIADRQCQAFTYNERAQWCFLKSGVGPRERYVGAISGEIHAVDRGQVIAADPLPLPDLSFLPEDTVRDATRLRAQALAAMRTGQTIGRFDPNYARRLTDGDASGWTEEARGLLTIQTDDWRRQQLLPQEAAASAYLGLTRATSPAQQAAALDVLSRALERQSLWRPAIEAMRTSLAIVETPGDQDRLAALRSEHGFRILDYSVDSDTASPRMCVQVSETLQGAPADIANYVGVEEIRDPIVSVDGKQLCVDGLKHGERYHVTIRSGLPSTVGESLEASAPFSIYVRDQSPTARFAGGAYVLPKSGAVGIPVTTVNTRELDIEILRIGDRGLAGTVRDGDFKRQLSSWEVERIADNTGARIWSGAMDVEMALNEEITTAFPVADAIDALEPGVYVMTAKPIEDTTSWGQLATQWFIVSDLGLAAMSGSEGVDAFVRSVASAEALSGVEVRLIARNDQVLASARTDDEGHVFLASRTVPQAGDGMTPALLVAETEDGDYAFLDMTAAGFELTDRGDTGRPAPGPLDAFVTPERGIYRGGETVHVTALLRSDRAVATTGVPLTLIVTRPDGVEERRIVLTGDHAGGFTTDIDLLSTAMTGTWRIAAHVDPKAPAIGGATFLVEDFVPERIEVSLEAADGFVELGGTLAIDVDARYLYGAPAAGLALEGETLVRPASAVPGFEGFRFGLEDDPFTPERAPLVELPRTGPDGTATISAPMPSVPATTRPLEAEVTVRVREPSGRAVEESLTHAVAPSAPMIGIRPGFSGGQVSEGATVSFEAIAIDTDGARTDLAGASWELLKVNRRYQWYRDGSAWSYEPIVSTERVASGTVDFATQETARISAAVDWGTYRLEVTDPDSAATATSVGFSAGWVSLSAQADTPDVLEVGLDRADYAPGDTARVRLDPRFAGTAVISVVADRLLHTQTVDVPAEGTSIDLAVDAAWGPGAYVTATLFRPMDVEAGRMPARAIGLDWLSLDREARTLDVSFELPDVAEPRQTTVVPVSIAGIGEGEQAYLTVAAVDVGILNLTGYEPPAPAEWYLGQRQLGVAMRDLYGDLIDSLGAVRGRIRSGGGAGPTSLAAAPPTQTPVSLFSGLVTVGQNGRAEIAFDIPAFNGTLKVMAIAWTNEKVGDAAADLVVRDPVVVSGSLPRFLAPGDATRIRFDLDNVDGPAGDYALSLAPTGPVVLDQRSASLTLDAEETATIEVGLSADAPGTGTITATLHGPDGSAFEQTFTLPVRPAAPPLRERRLQALAPGQQLSVGPEMAASLLPDDAQVTLSVTTGAPIDVPGILMALDTYPYGCVEQTTSRAMPLLYLAEVASEVGIASDPAIRERVDKAIRQVLALQDSSGAFGLWAPVGGDLWLNAYVTDFLTRAKEAGYTVPALPLSMALDTIQNTLSYSSDFQSGEGADVAYGLYVLARNGRASIGDLRYFIDERLDDFGTPLARAQIGAAVAFSGDRQRAERAFASAAGALPPSGADDIPGRRDYGSPLRDAAAGLTLVAESAVDAGEVPAFARAVTVANEAHGNVLTTQEMAWQLMAAHALGDSESGLDLSVDGLPHGGALYRAVSVPSLQRDPLTVTNRGEVTAEVAITVSGTPRLPLPAAASGLAIERAYYSLDGEQVDPRQVAQNARLVVVLTATEAEDLPAELLISDLLPAGFEIENPSLVTSADLAAFPWLQAEQTPAYTGFRDDRFVAAFSRSGNGGDPMIVAYMVRAVSPGTFAHPAPQVEDMYRAGRFARGAPASVTVRPVR
ncbi:alpha-2-macroglobulin family protein [Amorphus coralli]|uniref:alpha-2-macroglobulin family protein n=1 Tax=Amorphus coralli TaxID=340680 RepID=UPI00036DA9E4|nr:alpha-2-macroglobulin family protein [Amorphus coralli]